MYKIQNNDDYKIQNYSNAMNTASFYDDHRTKYNIIQWNGIKWK